MAQIAIPLVIAGALYLMSNDKKEDFTNPLVLEELERSDFIKDDKNINTYKLRQDNTTNFYNNIDQTSLKPENDKIYSQYQDKYLLQSKKKTPEGNHLFQTLAGTEMKYNDINHNNDNILWWKK